MNKKSGFFPYSIFHIPNSSKGQALRQSSGQVMLLTVMALSSGILGASVLSGLIVMAQLRQMISVKDSTLAIYAADAALECGLYREFKRSGFQCENNGVIRRSPDFPGFWALENGSRFTIRRYPDPDTGFDIIKGIGQMGEEGRGAVRAFEVQYEEVLPAP